MLGVKKNDKRRSKKSIRRAEERIDGTAIASQTGDAIAVAIEALKEEEKPKRWKPENDGDYWFLNSFGGANVSFWADDDMDKYRYKMGNCYKTEEECKFAAECMLVEQEPKKPVIRNYATYSVCACGTKIYPLYRYCPNCGQRIDWSVKNETDNTAETAVIE